MTVMLMVIVSMDLVIVDMDGQVMIVRRRFALMVAVREVNA